ncbi:MAG: hypothetical protein R2776_03520 [Flavobacteriaceae bacterium]|nr:hypothetical protein [Flavobacteriaceae bacterium]
MDFIKDIGIAGFLFFTIKGLLWLVLFAFIYFGIVSKEQVNNFKQKLKFWKMKKKEID